MENIWRINYFVIYCTKINKRKRGLIMKQEVLISKIKEYLKIVNDIKGINNMVVPERPIEPIACKVKEWNEYMDKKQAYDGAVFFKGDGLKSKEKEQERLKIEIINLLPKSNVWLITDDNKYAVGHQSDDWPSSNGTLKIKTDFVKEDLYALGHQIIN